ncbi:unnamed protein product [Sphagnum balticum]
MVKDSAEEVFKLHEYAHQRSEDCFKGIFDEGHLSKKLGELDKYKLPLNFVSEGGNDISKPKNDKYIKQFDNKETNVFETEESTVNLVNDISLLDAEEKYLSKVQAQLKNEK